MAGKDFEVRATPAAVAAIERLRGTARRSYEAFEAELRKQGCRVADRPCAQVSHAAGAGCPLSCDAMKTFRLDPIAGDQATVVVKAVDKLLREGKRVVVTIAEEQELLSAPADRSAESDRLTAE